jgi:hypothetical protein
MASTPPLHSATGRARLAPAGGKPATPAPKPTNPARQAAAKTNPVLAGAAGELRGKGRLTAADPNRGLLAEFLLCFVILGLGTIVAPPSNAAHNGVPRLMVKSSALAALFLILALVSAGSPKAAKAAGGLGALVTVGYTVMGADALNIFQWAARYFAADGGGAAAEQDSTQAPAPGGGDTGLGAAQ